MMRQSIILSNNYEQLFIHEAQKSGLIETLPNYADVFYDDEELREADRIYNVQLDSQHEKIQNLFRIILLFDEIILPHAPDWYDYDRLENNTQFKIFSFDDFYQDNPLKGEDGKQYAECLKPAILPVAENNLRNYLKVVPTSIKYSDLISAIYDSTMLGKDFPNIEYVKTLQINKRYFDRRNASNLKYAEFMNLPTILRKERRFFTDIAGLVISMFDELSWQLQISSDNDSAIMNCEYQLASIGYNPSNEEITSAMDAYQILRVECGKAIGTLPEAKNIQDVIHLKEKRHHDIHNLRQELSRLEDEIRNNGSGKAIDKAALDISRASKALSKGNTVEKVGKWATRFLLPLSVSSLFLQNPIITFGSGIVTALGQSSALIGDYLSKKNNWFELLI